MTFRPERLIRTRQPSGTVRAKYNVAKTESAVKRR
jgi:hypothetical protein